jgi:hypothetical protein
MLARGKVESCQQKSLLLTRGCAHPLRTAARAANVRSSC